ncbi:5-aminolevulinate synthase [Seohaeicola zhoushanensis]|uniref:5-aminolevulinate synthase n=1 Tax=Seohaeicola zhoushanensis TaxID=1569283 RepID=A0A8J3H0P3_9RHOB|nr:5-aminolevulinate synthase [Seohaeicola zhoushanensis]GHF59862.1 hypothetical protein GCM10017056_34090 [Seohaeicola zhoushanensis]
MTSDLNPLTIPMLIALTAAGYALATSGVTPQSAALVALGLLAAVTAEILLLRNSDLSVIYLAIIALETLIVLALAAWLGEAITPQRIAGAGLVLSGMALVAH